MQLPTGHRGGIGLSVLTASLLAMAVVLALSFKYQQLLTTKHVREEGISLARLITKLPGTEEQRIVAWQEIFAQQHRDDHFAYAAIADRDGKSVVEVTAAGHVVPPREVDDNGAWVKETSIAGVDRDYIEFHGPIGGVSRATSGYFRVGYMRPAYIVSIAHLPEVASLVLPVFLLVPVFLFFLRREVTPLEQVNAHMSALLPGGPPHPVSDTHDLRAFAAQFNQFVEQAKGQIAEYQDEASKLVTSEKFLNYRLQRFESILNGIPDGILVLDEEASVTFINTNAARIFHADAGIANGRHIAVITPFPELKTLFKKHTDNFHQLIGETIEFSPPDDSDTVFAIAVQQLKDAHASSYVVTVHNVSHEARARKSRSEFVAHLAHELKAPLNTLAMYTEALQTDPDGALEFRLEAANVISDEVERLARLINNLLSMTQIEMGTLELDRQRVKLVDLVKDATESMQRSARDRELEFVLDFPIEVIPVQIDKDLLRIAINNLLTNAIKYTDAGGTITVSVADNDDAITIGVADTGIGIDETDQARIFDKFYRSDNEDMKGRAGHGLGLPLAMDIVNLHHGSIRVNSTPGQGSRFYIDLWKHTGVMQQAI